MNLNSRYAPIIALGVLGLVIVLVLGYFLAVKPQINQAGQILADKQAVEANTLQVQQQSAKIDEYDALLAQDTGVGDSIALNVPSALDLSGFRTRVWSALMGSRAELVDFSQATTVPVEGWTADSRFLVSSQVASLFQTGPAVAGQSPASPDAAATPDPEGSTDVTTSDGTGWQPVVTPTTGVNPVASDITMISFTMTVAGTPSEAHSFLDLLTAPGQQLFQVYTVVQTARQASAAPIPGVADPQDGNVLTKITGALYFLGATGIADESGDGDVPALGPVDGGFNVIGPVGPQPGA